MEKAYHLSTTGRKGPILIDVPDNIQREKIIPKKLKSYKPNKNSTYTNDKNYKKKLIDLINKSKRPILILGWGVHLSNSYKEINKIIKRLNFPVVTTWAMSHILDDKNKLKVGTWGTHGSRYANFAVQNSDLILSLGSRLDTKATGSPINTFARCEKNNVLLII